MTISELIERLKAFQGDRPVSIEVMARFNGGYLKAKVPVEGLSYICTEGATIHGAKYD